MSGLPLSAADLNRLIATVDHDMRGQPGWDAWVALRTELRLRRRQSETTLPAVDMVAQHAEGIRNSAGRILDALSEVTTAPAVVPEDEKKEPR